MMFTIAFTMIAVAIGSFFFMKVRLEREQVHIPWLLTPREIAATLTSYRTFASRSSWTTVPIAIFRFAAILGLALFGFAAIAGERFPLDTILQDGNRAVLIAALSACGVSAVLLVLWAIRKS